MGRFFLTIFLFSLVPLSVSAETRILVIGDSHTTGTFKDGLLAKLDAETDFRTAAYGSCGSSPQHWMGNPKNAFTTRCGYYTRDYAKKSPVPLPVKHLTPDLHELLASDKPDVVVIAMGTNQLANSLGGSESAIADIIGLAKKDGAKCIWVGPPDVGAKAKGAANHAVFYDMLTRTTNRKGCSLVDSRPSTDPADVERVYWVHYSGNAGRSWGTAVGKRVVEIVREIGAAVRASPTPDRAVSGTLNDGVR